MRAFKVIAIPLAAGLLVLACNDSLTDAELPGTPGLEPTTVATMTFTSFDCPGSQSSPARGINDRGDIVGNCRDDNGGHAFLLRNGVFTIIDVPDAQRTEGAAINNRGDVVGQYLGSDDAEHGFLLRRGHFTTFDPPGSLETSARGIDDRGRIVGYYLGSDEVYRGFILDSDGYRDIEFPEAVITGAFGINSRSEIVGGYYDADLVPHGFLLKNGVFTSIDPPGAIGARAFGINERGHIVGAWNDDGECNDCFAFGTSDAFLLTPSGFTNLEFPDAVETSARGINNAGQIVGHYYAGEDRTLHGFLLSQSRHVR